MKEHRDMDNHFLWNNSNVFMFFHSLVLLSYLLFLKRQRKSRELLNVVLCRK